MLTPALARLDLRWPLPALLTWCACWLLYLAARHAGVEPWVAIAAALAPALAAAALANTRMRAAVIGLGFPLSLLAHSAAAALPGWAWLVLLALLAFVYPLRAWRDAPLFPTPAGALDTLGSAAPLDAGARVLDAGCGLGDGLRALRRAYPAAQLDGIEWSRPLAWLAHLRCRDARVHRGDLWAASWREFDLVYLFQRPESMAPALLKAEAELRPGAWLASLEFEIPGRSPQARHRCPDGRSVWLYRIGTPAQAPTQRADKALVVA